MPRGAKPAKVKVEAKPPIASKTRKSEGSKLYAVEKRLAETLEQQAATSEILRVISQSHTDMQPVFDAIVCSAVRLCGADHSIATRFDGELLHALAHYGFSPEAVKILERTYPMRPSHENIPGRVVLSKGVINIPDMLSDPTYSREYALAGGWRSGLGVPMLRDGELIGAIAVARRDVGAFPDDVLELLRTFADQAVIAIENVRLFTELDARNRDLTEALEQQTATSDILRVISQSSTDVQPVFDTIAAAALKLCGASSANVFTFDGELIRLAAQVNVSPEGADAVRSVYPRAPGRDNAASRVVLTCSVVTIPDVLQDPEYLIQTTALTAGFRSVLAVPLMREGLPIGAIAVGRAEPGPFPDKQVALLKTFADQAVIAIENVRLFTELNARTAQLTRSVGELKALGEVGQAVSSTLDLETVLGTIVSRATQLTGMDGGSIWEYDEIREQFHLHASDKLPDELVDVLRATPIRKGEGALGRLAVTGEPVEIRNIVDERSYQSQVRDILMRCGYRSVLAVPLLCENHLLGALAVNRSSVGEFAPNVIELLKTFATQSALAIQNARLFNETKEAFERQMATAEILRVIANSRPEVQPVFDAIVQSAARLFGRRASLRLVEANGLRRRALSAATTAGESADLIPIDRDSLVGRAVLDNKAVQVVDTRSPDALPYAQAHAHKWDYRSNAAVPLIFDGKAIGVITVASPNPGALSEKQMALLVTFADQAVIAIENVRLFNEIQDKSAQLEVASRHKSEFLANMSHELRTPLNAILGFSEVLSEKLFGEINDKQAEYLGDILESGRHLLSLINDILDLSKIEAGRMELEPTDFHLPGVIENTLTLVRERAHRHGIKLERTVDDRLGMIRADERKVKQVLLNLLSNALKFTPEGGRIDVHAVLRDGAAEISVTDTGVGIAPEDQEAIFEEFRQVGSASNKVEGTGLGLAIARKFIELHGGRIWVTSQVGIGSAFAFTLPLQ